MDARCFGCRPVVFYTRLCEFLPNDLDDILKRKVDAMDVLGRVAMPQYVMLMKGTVQTGDWGAYVDKLVATGMFRGGSALGNGICSAHGKADSECQVVGYMRFTAQRIEQVRALLAGNPHFEAGGCVELLEEVPD